MESISFGPVSAADFAEARDFIVKYFYAYEPMNRAYMGAKEPAQADVDFTVAYLAQGLGVKAVDGAGQIIGLSLGYIGASDDAEALRAAAGKATEQKWRDILKFLAFIQDRSNLREKCGVDVAYEIQLLAVHPKCRGKSIGTGLVQRQIEIARERRFEAVYVDCSSVFTGKIMRKLGFQCVQETKFAEYRTDEGLQIFQPEDETHTVMQSYFRRI